MRRILEPCASGKGAAVACWRSKKRPARPEGAPLPLLLRPSPTRPHAVRRPLATRARNAPSLSCACVHRSLLAFRLTAAHCLMHSLFPGLGFGAGYKILQRVYKFGGQPYVKCRSHPPFPPFFAQLLSLSLHGYIGAPRTSSFPPLPPMVLKGCRVCAVASAERAHAHMFSPSCASHPPTPLPPPSAHRKPCCLVRRPPPNRPESSSAPTSATASSVLSATRPAKR